MEKKIDRRIIKTKRAIRNAFAELLAEKEINNITVKDIADKADIDRKTFYNYYSGVYQVIDEIENEIISALESTISDVDFNNALQNPQIIFERLTKIINSDIEFYGHLLRMTTNVNLITKISDLLKEKVKAALAQQVNIDPLKRELIANFAISGMISTYQQWFSSDRSYPVEKFSQDVGVIIFKGIGGLIDVGSVI